MSPELREPELGNRNDLQPETVDARDLRGTEQDLAGGRSPLTPFALLTWVGITIALVAALVAAIAAVAYFVA